MSVLVVEDNAEVGTFATDALTELGYVTTLVGNAADALAKLAADADGFDVVFSDVVMPGISGIDLAREIRRHYFDLPVVLTSGYSHVLAQNGSYGFELLQKPYSIEQLAGVLHKVGRWRNARRGAAE
jgi:two-component system, NtrC family, sensor kinase